jgi:hypothetical protein
VPKLFAKATQKFVDEMSGEEATESPTTKQVS